jgi:hypothetical protein
MGAGASTIPDKLDKETAKQLAGDSWDEAKFDAVADAEGYVSAEQFTAAAAPEAAAPEAAATEVAAPEVAAPEVAAPAMIELAKGISFNTIAREWRMKYAADNGKAAATEVQALLDKHLEKIKATAGYKSINRVVCGGCMDFKVVISVDAAKFGDFETAEFAPEKEFLAAAAEITGVTNVETQTYTFMEL